MHRITDAGSADALLAHPRVVGNQAYLIWLAHALETAPRLGASPATPEGLRVLQMSDTLARQIAARLRTICEAL